MWIAAAVILTVIGGTWSVHGRDDVAGLAAATRRVAAATREDPAEIRERGSAVRRAANGNRRNRPTPSCGATSSSSATASNSHPPPRRRGSPPTNARRKRSGRNPGAGIHPPRVTPGMLPLVKKHPARAGMDPRAIRATGKSSEQPRTRGDGPCVVLRSFSEQRASPHTRGWTRAVVHKVRARGLPRRCGDGPCWFVPFTMLMRVPTSVPPPFRGTPERNAEIDDSRAPAPETLGLPG